MGFRNEEKEAMDRRKKVQKGKKRKILKKRKSNGCEDAEM